MYCNQCGSKLLDMAKFCSDCGHSQTSEVTDIQVQTSEQSNVAQTNFHLQFEKPHVVSSGKQKAAGMEWIIAGIILALVLTLPYWGILSLFDTTPGFWGILFWYWYPALIIIIGINYCKMSDQEWNEKVAQDEVNAKYTKILLTNFAIGFIRGYFSNKR